MRAPRRSTVVCHQDNVGTTNDVTGALTHARNAIEDRRGTGEGLNWDRQVCPPFFVYKRVPPAPAALQRLAPKHDTAKSGCDVPLDWASHPVVAVLSVGLEDRLVDFAPTAGMLIPGAPRRPQEQSGQNALDAVP
jgi:hypothetical protein